MPCVTLYHKAMSESRNDGKAGLARMQCLNKFVRDRHLKKFSAITVWKWLDEASASELWMSGIGGLVFEEVA